MKGGTMTTWRTILAVGTALLLGTAAPSLAQQPGANADPADVETLDGIMGALYESISGPAGAPRDWDRLRSLLAPGARFIPTGQAQDGSTGALAQRDASLDRSRGHRVEQAGLLLRVLCSRVVQEAAPLEQAQGAIADRAAELGDVFVRWSRQRVEVDVQRERAPEALHEVDCARARAGQAQERSAPLLPAEDGAQEQAPHGAAQGRVVGQLEAQSPREGQHPLAHGHVGED